MSKAGYPSGPGAGPKGFDTSTNAGHYGAGGGSGNQGSGQIPGEPATLDISLGGGFLQGTGSVANNVFDDPQHVGGVITFQSSSVEAALDRSKYPYPRYKIPQNQIRRFQIFNEKRVILNRPLEILDSESGGGDFIFPELDQTNLTFSMSFENTDVIPATSTTFLGSYADVTLGNLRTYSGDIHRMKVYARHQNDQSEDFNRIGDFVVRDKNELIDKTSPTGQAPIGTFYSQSVIDTHWISSSNTTGKISVANNELISAAFLSGSNRGVGEFFDFQTKDYISLRKAQDYIVNFSSYFIKKPKVQSDGSVVDSAKIELLLSGSINSSQMEVLSLGTISGEGDDSSETLEGRISGSIPNLFNYFRTYSNVAGEASASLVFRVHAGEFHVSNVALRPLTFANFHPDSYNVRLPMPKKAARNQQYDFRVEFYDFNNNKSVATTESTASVFFSGTNDVIDGLDNKIEGAQTWGNAMEAYGVSGNSAYLRSIGYNGFDKTRAGSGERNGGFLLFSGSIGSRITASEAYDGVGIEIVDASVANNHKFLQFRSSGSKNGEATFKVQTDDFYFGKDRTQANAQFISGSQGKIEISSSNFHLDNDGSIIMQGTITAEAGGTVGGFTLGGSSMFSGTQPEPTFFISGSGHSGTNFAKRNLFISASQFQVNAQGVVSASAGKIAAWTLSGNNISSDGAGIRLNGNGDASEISINSHTFGGAGIQLGFNGGSPRFYVGDGAQNFIKYQTGASNGVNIKTAKFELDTPSVEISTTQASMSLGTGQEITMRGGGGNSPYIALQPSVALASKNFGEDGIFFGVQQGTTPKFSVASGSSNHLKFDGTTLDISSTIFKLDTDRLDIDSSTSRISVFDDAGSPKERIRIGEVDGGSVYGMKIFDGTGTADSDILVEFGEGGNKIAGWTISDSTISSNNLILNSAGEVRTTTYTPGLRGFRLSSAGNGFLEVENAKIRGTLKTTVFEKESVNAVGGQLQVGNATVITGSAQISATATTIPVENVTGFTGSEIIMAKKQGASGFSTEYMLITSQSRRDKTSNTDFSGSLFVTRGYSGSNPIANMFSGSIGDTGTAGTTLEPGQVLVSTGFYNAATSAGSGYIRLNANPKDPATPYIDIVERTGSKIYEVDLKARLGDLSGLSTAQVGSSPGFGLFSENVFLTGKITATSGAIGGFTIDSDEIKSTNLLLDSNNEKITVGSSNAVTIQGGGTDNFIRFGSKTTYGQTTTAGVILGMDATVPTLELFKDANNKFIFNNSGIEIKSTTFDLDTVSSNVGITMDSNIATLIAQSGSQDTAVRIVGVAGTQTGGALQVSQSGMPLLQVGGGETQIFSTLSNMQMASVPLVEQDGQLGQGATTTDAVIEELGQELALLSDRPSFSEVENIQDSVASGVGIPTVRMATAVVEAHLSASKINAGQSLFLRNQRVGSTKNTKFRTFLNDTAASGSSKNVQVGFDIRKLYPNSTKAFESSDFIHQTMAFSTIFQSANSNARFTPGTTNTGSAVYHFQAMVSESANDKWADGKLALMRLDVDTSDLYKLEHRKEFVFIEARESTGSGADNTANGPATKQRVFQVQASGSVVANGNITAFGASSNFLNVSDVRLKEDIYNVSGSLNKILELRPTHFTWKLNKKQDVGFIAQEVEEIIPEVVETSQGFINTDGEQENDLQDIKTVSYSKLVPYLVDTIQVMDKRIKELEKKVK